MRQRPKRTLRWLASEAGCKPFPLVSRSQSFTSDRGRHTGGPDKGSWPPDQMDRPKSLWDRMLARAATERLCHGLPSPHFGNVCSAGGVTVVLQNSPPKSEAKSLQQLPGRELSSSSSRSLHYLRSYPSGVIKVGSRQTKWLPFRKSASYGPLQSGQSVPSGGSSPYRVLSSSNLPSRLDFDKGRISLCVTSSRPVQMMSGK